jgi:hypothetical protein
MPPEGRKQQALKPLQPAYTRTNSGPSHYHPEPRRPAKPAACSCRPPSHELQPERQQGQASEDSEAPCLKRRQTNRLKMPAAEFNWQLRTALQLRKQLGRNTNPDSSTAGSHLHSHLRPPQTPPPIPPSASRTHQAHAQSSQRTHSSLRQGPETSQTLSHAPIHQGPSPPPTCVGRRYRQAHAHRACKHLAPPRPQ